MMPPEPSQIRPAFGWDAIDCVLLDMDGTLLDKYFDDYFWEHYVPEVYARLNDRLCGIWQQQGRHAFLHHLNALFGYVPLLVSPDCVSGQLCSF